MSHQQRALLALVLLLWRVAVAEYSTKTELDYEFGDYRGKWCIDDHGFVYGIGEVYYPSPSACPCTCTVDGPVCVRPRCPRIHPRCTRIRYQACCPVCEAMARVCVYGGKTYRLLEEFRVRDLRPSAPLYKLWKYNEAKIRVTYTAADHQGYKKMFLNLFFSQAFNILTNVRPVFQAWKQCFLIIHDASAFSFQPACFCVQLSRCERCRCEANREVYCSISDCPAPHCVNPTYEPNHCCPVCRSGESRVWLKSEFPGAINSFLHSKCRSTLHICLSKDVNILTEFLLLCVC